MSVTVSGTRDQQRRVALASLVGTTIEWYDFFIYSNAAAIVFASLFFEPLGSTDATILSFATVGISFFFRPLGAIIAGHLGDKLGRRAILVFTLYLMGAATVLIGVLPTYSQIGVLAPVLLVILRIVQGFSAGGEWGGAALLAVEHAPSRQRGLFGAYPQVGVPAGMLLATAVLSILSATLTDDQFNAWGWRIPFLLSIVLIAVGGFIRKQVAESPVFVELRERKQRTKAPLVDLFRDHWRKVVLAALVFMGNGVAGYMSTGGYVLSYATKVLGVERTPVLVCVCVASATWIRITLYGGACPTASAAQGLIRSPLWRNCFGCFRCSGSSIPATSSSSGSR